MERIILAGILIIGGCSNDYEWTKVSEPSKQVVWSHVSERSMYSICGDIRINLAGCAIGVGTDTCTIVSEFSEYDAHRIIIGDGLTLWEHEMKHCGGYIHPYISGR